MISDLPRMMAQTILRWAKSEELWSSQSKRELNSVTSQRRPFARVLPTGAIVRAGGGGVTVPGFCCPTRRKSCHISASRVTATSYITVFVPYVVRCVFVPRGRSYACTSPHSAAFPVRLHVCVIEAERGWKARSHRAGNKAHPSNGCDLREALSAPRRCSRSVDFAVVSVCWVYICISLFLPLDAGPCTSFWRGGLSIQLVLKYLQSPKRDRGSEWTISGALYKESTKSNKGNVFVS